MESANDDYDTPWKLALVRYFPAFMEFYFASAYGEIDWSQPPLFLDQELAQLTRGARRGRRRVDLLVQLRTLAGEQKRVLVHVEVQGRHDRHFAERVFTYNYRLYDRYRQPVASLLC